ncbi:MAG: M4 family metallopeptidase, partial [Chitinophagaceae bacterium]
RYQQYYRGIKVENAEYLVHGKGGSTEVINGDFHRLNTIAILPRLSEAQALDKALGFVNAKRYKWQDAALESLVKKNTGDPAATYYPKGEIVITKDFLKGGTASRLAWKFTISSALPANEQWIYVDAASGEVIRETPLVCSVNTPCTAQTVYSGTLGITGDSFGGGFRLREDRNGVNVQTLDLQNTMNYGGAIDFVNSNTGFTNGSWTNFAQDRDALDAHWGAEMVLDYWNTVHSRNSLNGSGIRLLSYVHADLANAQWVGGVNNRFMQYGDIGWGPLTALDICAHETGHGITEFTAGLTPGTQESGALNEGFSDIWAACVERWAAPAKQTWLVGEEIFGGFLNGIRNMQNPNDNTTGEGSHPDTYLGNFWDGGGEPHFNSTVLSHWFFLLTEGGTGTNDNSNAFNVTGIGISDAERIAFRALSVYLNSSANYAAARNATIQAARDLFGTNSCQEASTTNAWFAVGVGAAFVYPAYPSFLSVSGSSVVCGSSANYTVAGLPAGATVSWSLYGPDANGHPLPLQYVCDLSQTGNQATLTKVTDGTVKLFATVSNCGGVMHYATITVTFGIPELYPYAAYNPNWVYMPVEGTVTFTGSTLNYVTLESSGNNTYYWEYGAGTGNSYYYFGYTGPSFAYLGWNTPVYPYDYLGFSIHTTNACGTRSDPVYFYYDGPYLYYRVAPNPVRSSFTISQTAFRRNPAPPGRQPLNTDLVKVQIADKMGNIVLEQACAPRTTTATINVAHLRPDVYTVRLFTGNKTETHKIIIEH